MLTESDARKLRELMLDPVLRIRKLTSIIDENNEWAKLDPLFEEQIATIAAFQQYNQLFVLKCRQIGMTTIMSALMFWKLFMSPSPRRLLAVAHEHGAAKRVVSMIRLFWSGLPAPLRPPLSVDNAFQLEFSHNSAGVFSLMAGGRGQGRSYTYSDALFTEVGYWPSGTPAHGKGKDTSTDFDMYQSSLATIHAPDAHIVVEGTADGPRGLQYQLFQDVQKDPDWGFLFFPWYGQRRYTKSFNDDRARREFEESLTAGELFRIEAASLTLEQMHWYRSKANAPGYTPTRMRREFPEDPSEPFLVDAQGWFDQGNISDLMKLLPPGRANASVADEYIQWFPYQSGRSYFVSLDTSGGTGGDYCSCKVIRDDMVPVAMFRSNTVSPEEQHLIPHRMGMLYGANDGNKPLCLIEANRHGATVLANARSMSGFACRLWVHPHTGKDFFMTGGPRSGESKKRAYAYARKVIDAGLVPVQCFVTLTELQHIVELPNGEIKASEGHDDNADALVLGLWCGHSWFEHFSTQPTEADRTKAMLRFARDPLRRRTR